MTVSIVDVDEGFDDFFASVKNVTSMEVTVGYDQDSGSRGDIGLADLAIIHEFGDANIPARPAMRQSFDNNQQEIGDFGIKLLDKTLEGRIGAETAYEVWGDFYKGKLQTGITSRELGLQENSAATIKRKGSDTPLVDTGRLVNGSRVKVEKK